MSVSKAFVCFCSNQRYTKNEILQHIDVSCYFTSVSKTQFKQFFRLSSGFWFRVYESHNIQLEQTMMNDCTEEVKSI